MAFSDYRCALVTGASSGIGAAIVQRFRREGLVVHAAGRRRDRIEALAAETGAVAHVIDVRDTPALNALAASLPVDVLVNNAGMNHDRSIATATAADLDDIITVDLAAVTQLTRAVLPKMIAGDRGHIVNIGSIAGLHSFPGHAAYHAAKAGVHAFSQQLRVDLHGTRIRVTEVCPGRTATEIFGKTIGDDEAGRTRFIDGFDTLMPVDIAEAVAFAVAAPWRVDISLMEIWPTYQVHGGLHFYRPDGHSTSFGPGDATR